MLSPHIHIPSLQWLLLVSLHGLAYGPVPHTHFELIQLSVIPFVVDAHWPEWEHSSHLPSAWHFSNGEAQEPFVVPSPASNIDSSLEQEHCPSLQKGNSDSRLQTTPIFSPH